MVLDFLDALAGAVAIAYWWCTWVRPAKPERPSLSAPAEIDGFVSKARAQPGSRIVPVTSGQRPRSGEVTPPA
jgi:hypothetical protein